MNKEQPWEKTRDEAMEERERALKEVKAKLDRSDGDFWGMYYTVHSYDAPYTKTEIKTAIKRLNAKLYRAIKDIPKYGTINQGYIEEIVIARMESILDEHADFGVADSEGRYGICDVLELYFEICA